MSEKVLSFFPLDDSLIHLERHLLYSISTLFRNLENRGHSLQMYRKKERERMKKFRDGRLLERTHTDSSLALKI